MTTFTYQFQTYTAVYVDPTATGTGDGSTPTNARTTMPTVAAMAANTAYIVRRSTSELSWTVGSNANNYVIVMGCPKSVDMMADVVPAEVMTAWGADSADYATLLMSSNTTGAIFTGTDFILERAEIRTTTTAGANTSGTIQATGTRPTIRKCFLRIKATDYTDALPANLNRVPLQVGTNSPTVADCIIHAPGNSAILTSASTDNFTLVNTDIRVWDNSSNAILGPGTTSTDWLIDNCTFQIKYANLTTYTTLFTCSTLTNTTWRNCTFTLDSPVNSNVTVFTFTSTLTTFINCSFTLTASGTTGTGHLFSGNTTTRLIFRSCTITQSTTSTSATVPVLFAGVNFIVKDCTITWDGLLTTAASYDVVEMWDNNTINSGTLTFDEQIYVPTHALTKGTKIAEVSANGIVYVGSGTYSGPTTIDLSNNARFFIDNCNIIPTLSFVGSTEYATYYARNENGVSGQWRAENLSNKMSISTAYRTGSAVTYSIKAEGKVANTTGPFLYCAPRPFNGIPVVFASTGRKRVTMYFAYKIYGEFNPNELCLEIEIPAAASGTATKTITARSNGNIVSDSSTWNNDTGLTVRRMEVVFDLLRAENVQCRIGFNKYTLNAYCYIDPTIVGASA
jgi:hypothetical protein